MLHPRPLHMRRALLSLLLVACMDQLSVSSQVRAPDPAKELVITDLSVVRDPYYTVYDPAATGAKGAWSFKRLIHNMLPPVDRGSDAAASRLVLDFLRTWDTPQSPNPEVTPTRVRPLRLMVTAPWKALSGCPEPMSPETDAGCVLDLTQAPFELIAIVNRPDLRIIANDDTAIAGEGRFLFQVIGPSIGIDEVTGQARVWDWTPRAQKMSVILEYELPVTHFADTLVWAKHWHNLGDLPFGAAYNSVLERLTSGFSGPDVDLRRLNGRRAQPSPNQ
jgi:hypothetical protein